MKEKYEYKRTKKDEKDGYEEKQMKKEMMKKDMKTGKSANL